MRAARAGRAFSLTELLVVVAIILILVTSVIVGSQAVYGRAMRLKCQSRLEQIGEACRMYASEHAGRYPRVWDFSTQRRWYEMLVTNYLPHPDIIGCPLEPTPELTSGVEGGFEGSDTVLLGLEWLADHQEPAGNWDVGSWGGNSGTRGQGYRTGVTALALMCFLFYGCTDQYPTEYADNVAGAIDWLISRQEASGKFNGYNNGTWYLYDHGTATMAMCHAYMATGRADCRASAQKALQHLLNHQKSSESYGWGYTDKRNDVSVTGWCFQAVDAGYKAGLLAIGADDGNVLGVSGTKLNNCLKTMVHSTDYRCTYRYGPHWDADRGYDRRYAATAISLTSRLLMGHRPGGAADQTSDSGRCRGVVNWLHGGSSYITYAHVEPGSRKSLYYYYYMTLANSLLGGSAWSEWSDSVFPEELAEHQVKTEGIYKGSWPVDICRWGGYGGRVYTTALSILALEAGMPGHWEPGTPAGECSYGYNASLDDTRGTPAADTVVVMDYAAWVVRRGGNEEGEPDPLLTDADDAIALRHGGRANVLFGDGRVEALELEDFRPGMWTPDPGD